MSEDKGWEILIASVTIEIGPHTYRARIIRREGRYYIHRGMQYQEFDGKGNDDTATVLGLTQIALLLGRELDEFAQPKGPAQEQ